MDDRIDFTVYCIEEYKAANKMTGREVVKIFDRYNVLNYIRKYYEALHTTGRQYILDDINGYIKSQI